MWAERAVKAATAAAELAGVSGDHARLLRLGENATVYFPTPGVLAKVVAGPDSADPVRHELAVARWLSPAGIPTVRPVADEPLLVDGCVVALWEYLRGAESADPATLARCLRDLHAVAIPDHPVLPPVEPFARFDARLASAHSLTAEDRTILNAIRDRLAEQWQEKSPRLRTSVIHGDAHMENLLMSGGRLAFVDLEHVAVGPPEWDLTLTALYYECGWFSAEQYESFVSEYGFDVRAIASWPVLRGIRMLRMTTWLAQTAADYQDRQVQLRHRIASLKDGTAPAGWTGF